MLTTDIDQDGIALVTIDMPGRSMNVIDWPLADALRAEIARLAGDPAVTGIVFASGKSSFIAGADLAIMADFVGPGTSPKTAADMIGRLSEGFRALETCGKPVVAAASGTALGGGLELMLACHYRIAARNDKAVFGLPEVKLGLLPGGGGTQRLPRLTGVAYALPLLLEGKGVSAEEALKAGFLDEVVEPDDLVAAARRALKEGRVPSIARWDQKGFALPGPAANSTAVGDTFLVANAQAHARGRGNYPALKAILSCVYEGIRLPTDKALKIERHYFGHLVHGDVAQAMIRTLFFARQRLAKTGRGKADPGGAYAAALRAAFVREAQRLVGGGLSPAFVQNAALVAGFAAGPFETVEAAPARGTDRATLRPTGERLLRAVALAAVAALDAGLVGDADEADVHAIDVAGYPAWTGGPLTLIDRIGAAAMVLDATGEGQDVPERLAALARSGGSFHSPGEAAA
ncbi:enoyl-CoA hydratase-related protein [Polymorphum gilvum]|uniref:Putative bifunctional anaerobic fatty acid oxidation complex protein (FadJ/fadB-like): enoyl-CoA hydratase/epimerase/isomerase (N-terminal) 3-hydroxyacyl-CoA dehydrogenase (C-terminal) n=1 Tax=Polymorphum gilvum (strain LMG 25793 / CGMCC 1.9160 / SL003B-26A1) TaxID=991905 RepID=F2J2M4_POLGS|nr:enoyl-CoA hydratase-related protein [Polymorphum gilvum]ADZ70938.1 Putative bifunctional anaerobic fatty acid oxidation complex protein (FadJ/fadB-like): enoyl-CoA hydratase/epimerase/isomerase (N-terminal); 3-hydroxyacyl-CoA dehydrogenase (C-terminal) [Polymorphum gilvum SL003B-26A1]